jgi:hypothetical protein
MNYEKEKEELKQSIQTVLDKVHKDIKQVRYYRSRALVMLVFIPVCIVIIILWYLLKH